jgi:hypothetical protein
VENPKGRCLKADFNKAFSNTIPLQKKLGVESYEKDMKKPIDQLDRQELKPKAKQSICQKIETNIQCKAIA